MANKVGVLYSGGVDSSLVADKMAKEADEVVLITCFSCSHSVPKNYESQPEQMLPRVKALRERNPGTKFSSVLLPAQKIHQHLWRKARLEMFKVGLWANMPCATCNPANLAVALVYCIENGITSLAGGHNVMMACYPYQHPTTIDMIGQFCESFGVTALAPVFWYKNEDVMLLYQFDEFKNDPAIQNNILWDQTTNKEANAIGLGKGNFKLDFKQKNAPQVICLQDCTVNYLVHLFYYPLYGWKGLERRINKHLELQLKTLRGLIETYLEKGRHAEMFRFPPAQQH